jgi:hypothetical protein
MNKNKHICKFSHNTKISEYFEREKKEREREKKTERKIKRERMRARKRGRNSREIHKWRDKYYTDNKTVVWTLI